MADGQECYCYLLKNGHQSKNVKKLYNNIDLICILILFFLHFNQLNVNINPWINSTKKKRKRKILVHDLDDQSVKVSF